MCLLKTLNKEIREFKEPYICVLYKNVISDQNNKSLLTLVSIKVEKILKGSLDSIPSPSPLVKIQIMGGKGCLQKVW